MYVPSSTGSNRGFHPQPAETPKNNVSSQFTSVQEDAAKKAATPANPILDRLVFLSEICRDTASKIEDIMERRLRDLTSALPR